MQITAGRFDGINRIFNATFLAFPLDFHRNACAVVFAVVRRSPLITDIKRVPDRSLCLCFTSRTPPPLPPVLNALFNDRLVVSLPPNGWATRFENELYRSFRYIITPTTFPSVCQPSRFRIYFGL